MHCGVAALHWPPGGDGQQLGEGGGARRADGIASGALRGQREQRDGPRLAVRREGRLVELRRRLDDERDAGVPRARTVAPEQLRQPAAPAGAHRRAGHLDRAAAAQEAERGRERGGDGVVLRHVGEQELEDEHHRCETGGGQEIFRPWLRGPRRRLLPVHSLAMRRKYLARYALVHINAQPRARNRTVTGQTCNTGSQGRRAKPLNRAR